MLQRYYVTTQFNVLSLLSDTIYAYNFLNFPRMCSTLIWLISIKMTRTIAYSESESPQPEL